MIWAMNLFFANTFPSLAFIITNIGIGNIGLVEFSIGRLHFQLTTICSQLPST
jgi:hypothetical protein